MGTVVQDKKDLIHNLAEKAAHQCGVEIYSITIQPGKKITRIDVRIDNGAVVSHDDCADYSRALATLLDEEEVPDYTLEISSPGFKRELRTIEQCSRFVGAPVKLIFLDKGRSPVKGILESVDGDTLIIKEGKKTVTAGFDTIKTARLDY